jgi:hypothetical protein
LKNVQQTLQLLAYFTPDHMTFQLMKTKTIHTLPRSIARHYGSLSKQHTSMSNTHQ